MSSDKRIDDLLDDIKLARDKIYEVNGLEMWRKAYCTNFNKKCMAGKKIKTDWEMIQKIINGKA